MSGRGFAYPLFYLCHVGYFEEDAMSERGVVVIDVRNVYGVEKYYPANETAEIFARINQAKTLSKQTLSLIKVLGYSVEVKPKEVLL